MVNKLDCDIVVSEFDFQFRYNVHFGLIPMGKLTVKASFSNLLNSTTNALLQESFGIR